MRKNLKTIFLIAAILLIISCKNEQSIEKIPGVHLIAINNPTISNLDSCIAEYEFIPLETTEDCLIHSVHKIQVTDSFMYVLDGKMKEIFIFNKQGKYLNKISNQGQGPEEYTFINDFSLDPFKSRLILTDSFSKRLFIFNKYGEKEKIIQLKNIPLQIIAKSDGAFINLYGGSNNYYESKDLENYHIHALDSMGNFLKGFLPDQTKKRIDIQSVQTANYLPSREILYKPKLSDTIYKISNDLQYYPYGILENNSSYQQLTPKERNKVSFIYNKVNDYERLEQNKVLLPSAGFLHATHSMFFSFGWNNRISLFYSTVTKKTIFFTQQQLEKNGSLLSKTIFLKAPCTIFEDNYYSSINYSDYSYLTSLTSSHEELKNIILIKKIEENPIIIRYKLNL